MAQKGQGGGTVSLPMYDLPEARRHTDALLASLADSVGGLCAEQELRDRSLSQQSSSAELWDDSRMAISQMCGLALHDRQSAADEPSCLRRLGTP
eukprot:7343239-Prymnesium_polylepis.1